MSRHPARLSVSRRLLALLTIAAVFVAACAGKAADGEPQIGGIPTHAAFGLPFLVGRSSDEMERYLTWFQGSDDVAPGLSDASASKGVSASILDPDCGLKLAYTWMASHNGGPSPMLRLASVKDATGFVNSARNAALYVLQGALFGDDGHGNRKIHGVCGREDQKAGGSYAYVPVIIDFGSNQWRIDTLASQGAEVTISVQNQYQNAAISTSRATELAERDFISPLRLSRFEVTDENLQRVIAYSTVKPASGSARRIYWFRKSDLSGIWQGLALGGGKTCGAGFYAFWGGSDGNNDPVKGCGGVSYDISSHTDRTFLDQQTRQGKSSLVADRGDDDQCADPGNGQKGCPNNDDWSTIEKDLAVLVGPGSIDTSAAAPMDGTRKAAVDDIRKILGGGAPKASTPAASSAPTSASPTPKPSCVVGTVTVCSGNAGSGSGSSAGQSDFSGQNAPPDSMGGWDNLQGDVFGIIASNGRSAWSDTRDVMRDNAIFADIVPWAGYWENDPSLPTGGAPSTVVLAPSFSYQQVKTDEQARDLYNSYSWLMGNGSQAFMTVTTENKTSGKNDEGLVFHQGPLQKFTFVVSDAVSGHTSTYNSTYIPTWLTGVSSSEINLNEDIPFWDVGRQVGSFFHNFFRELYDGFIGGPMSSLARSTVSNMLNVPALEPFTINGYDYQGNPIYKLKDDVIKPSLISDASNIEDQYLSSPTERSSTKAAAAVKDFWGRQKDLVGICTNGAYNDPVNFSQPDVNDPSKISYADCYEPNPLFIIWEIARGILFALIMLATIAYAFSFVRDTRRKMPPLAFFARVVAAVFIAFGMDTVVRLMAIFVADAIVLTNIIGTQVGGGVPYSHLWLFSSYLGTAGSQANIWSLFVVAPFVALGLIFVLITSVIRVAMSIMVLLVSPIWVTSLLFQENMGAFFTSMRWVFRLYLIPFVTLILLLVAFAITHATGWDVTMGANLFGAIIGMLLLILVAFVPWMVSRYLVAIPMAATRALIEGAINAAQSSKANDLIEAGIRGVDVETAASDRAKMATQLAAAGAETANAAQLAAGGGATPGMIGPGGAQLGFNAGVTEHGRGATPIGGDMSLGSLRASNPGADPALASIMGGTYMQADAAQEQAIVAGMAAYGPPNGGRGATPVGAGAAPTSLGAVPGPNPGGAAFDASSGIPLPGFNPAAGGPPVMTPGADPAQLQAKDPTLLNATQVRDPKTGAVSWKLGNGQVMSDVEYKKACELSSMTRDHDTGLMVSYDEKGNPTFFDPRDPTKPIADDLVPKGAFGQALSRLSNSRIATVYEEQQKARQLAAATNTVSEMIERGDAEVVDVTSRAQFEAKVQDLVAGRAGKAARLQRKREMLSLDPKFDPTNFGSLEARNKALQAEAERLAAGRGLMRVVAGTDGKERLVEYANELPDTRSIKERAAASAKRTFVSRQMGHSALNLFAPELARHVPRQGTVRATLAGTVASAGGTAAWGAFKKNPVGFVTFTSPFLDGYHNPKGVQARASERIHKPVKAVMAAYDGHKNDPRNKAIAATRAASSKAMLDTWARKDGLDERVTTRAAVRAAEKAWTGSDAQQRSKHVQASVATRARQLGYAEGVTPQQMAKMLAETSAEQAARFNKTERIPTTSAVKASLQRDTLAGISAAMRQVSLEVHAREQAMREISKADPMYQELAGRLIAERRLQETLRATAVEMERVEAALTADVEAAAEQQDQEAQRIESELRLREKLDADRIRIVDEERRAAGERSREEYRRGRES